jgi:hypothetical protein
LKGNNTILAALIVVTVLVVLGFRSFSPGSMPDTPPAVARSGDFGSLGPGDISARVRVIQRLGRRGRLNEANDEAQRLMALAPDFDARRWVTQAYNGVRRADEREDDIRLLVSLGLPAQRARKQP